MEDEPPTEPQAGRGLGTGRAEPVADVASDDANDPLGDPEDGGQYDGEAQKVLPVEVLAGSPVPLA
jgi:hypothetical protein